ncbi:hypothetical protein DRQ25_04700 [Candidatus Fermentibacteria bacterium]|nr:MAG: hypothetical protein DRQ25_04700 [Candidatus Fermentibacteria bacterium]
METETNEEEERSKIDVLMQSFMEVYNIGQLELANQIKERVMDEITFIERDDWMSQQICGTFPTVDIRCIAFCCTPAKNCPYRNMVLEKLHLTGGDYTKFKKEIGEIFKQKIGGN